MKLFLRRTVILLCLFTGIVHYAQAQTIGAGDLVFTGINIFDDNNTGSMQNDAFSFVLLRDCPANTTIYFTDLGWTGSGFQPLACSAGSGSQTDGVIQWSSGSTAIRAGKQIVVSCKYSPTATVGTVSTVTPTNNSKNDTYIAWISLGLAGDQLFAFTGSVAAPTIIGGINVNRKTWESSLSACDFTSSSSVKPATSAVLDFPSINAVNARYNCSTLLGVPASLRSQIQDTTQWSKDYTLSTSFPSSFNLKNTPSCDLTVVVPDANGIVYVNNQSATPGGGSSWSMPLPELRDALTAAAIANSGIKQIWVAKGTYKPTASGGSSSATFNIPADVAVYGGFAGTEATLAARNIPANPVILSGDIDNNDVLTNSIVLRASDIRGNNSFQLLTVPVGASTKRVLDGVTITGGNAIGAGAGIFISGDITITNAKFYGNAASIRGGALYAGAGNVALSNCIFFGNRSNDRGGAIAQDAGTLKLTNVTVGGNSTANGGGGLLVTGGAFTTYNTIISGNTSAISPQDTYFSGGTNNFYYSILDDQYYTNTATHQATPAVIYTDFANGDLRLTTANYGINKGDPQTNNSGYIAQAGTLDLAGQTRISNTIIDLGAYEYQAIPQTLNIPGAPMFATYGDENIDPGATTTGDGTITYTSDNTAVAQIVNGKIKTTGAGNSTLIKAYATATNTYLPAGPKARLIIVNPKPLTIKADDVSRPYGSPNPAATFTYTGFVYSEDASVLTGAATAVFGATQTSNVGTYPITTDISGVSSNNYTLSAQNGTLTITQQQQTISFTLPSNATYGDAPLTLTLNTDAGLPIVYTVSGPASISGNTLTITGAGDITVTANQPGDANRAAAPQVQQTFTVAKAVLTFTANDKNRPYNQANPALDYNITGFVNSENSSVLSGTADISTTADISSPAGNYPITINIGSLSAANYSFSFVNATLSISQAPQTISFPAIGNQTYGNPITLNATSSSGLAVTYTVTSGPATINGNIVTTSSAGDVTITATQAGDVNYTAAAPVPVTFRVFKRNLFLKIDNQQRPYGMNNPALTYTWDSFVNGDDASAILDVPQLSTTADASSSPGAYPITVPNLGDLTSFKYNVIPVNGTLTVSMAPQTISFPAIADKTYGDAAFALNATSSSGLTVSYSVVSGPVTLSGNNLTITGTGTVTIAADQAGDGNYSAATRTTQTFNVNKAALTLTANNKTKSYLQANPALDYTVTGFVNGENNSVVSGAADINTTAAINSTPGTYPITVTTGSLGAANYTFSFVNGTLTVNQATQTISFPAITDKTYGDAAFSLNASSNSGLAVTYSVVSGPATISGSTVTITGAGTVTIAADQAGDGNYLAATQTTQTFNVNKAVLTVTANDKTKTYLQANPALDYVISGFVNSENNSVVSGIADITTTADINSTPGTYPVTVAVGSLAAANYTFSFVNGTLTVNQAGQTISFPAIADKTYGDAAFALNATSNSGLTVSYSVVSGPATIAGNTVTITGAGTVTIAADQAGDANYLAATQATQTFAVNKAILSVTANDKTKAYLQANPALDYAITGFVYSENIGVVSGTAAINTTAALNSAPGTYPITVGVGSLSAANYTFSFVNGTLTVNQATQTISFPAITDKTYGDAAFALNASSNSGLAITYSVVSGPATISGNTITITGTGAVTIAADQAGDANYFAAAQATQTFNVNKAVLTLTANDKAKAYLQANPALDYTITGFVYNEDNTVVSGAANINTSADINSTPGTYPITAAAGNISAANYTFNFVDGTLTVGKAAQTISFPAITDRTYGDASFALNATCNSGLTVSYSVVSGPATINGNMVTITGAGTVTIAADQAGDGNYLAATQSTQTFNVNKAVLTISANDKTKVYLQANPTLDYTITGFVNSENNSVISGTAAINTTADINSTPGIYPITIATGSLNAANYSFSFVNGTLTIGRASQTIIFPAITDKTYGDAAFTLNASSNSGLAITYLVVSGPAAISGNTLTITGAGSVTVRADLPGNANYTAANPVSNTFQVAPATLTLTADDKQRSYGAANPVLTYTITGFVNGDNSSVVSGVANISTSANTSSAPGTYPITVAAGNLNAANYTFSFANGTLTISKSTQSISFPAITAKTYGDAAFTLNAGSTSGLAVTYIVVSGPATINGNTLTITGAGNVTIAADQAGDASFAAAAQATQTFTVNKAVLTLTANDKTRTYLQANPALDYVVSGFVNSENSSVLSGNANISTTANTNSTPGTYPITVTAGSLNAANYSFNFVNGTLTISQASQSISFPAISGKTYGDPAFTLNGTSSSGLALNYTVTSGPATINGNTLTITGAGSITVQATQAGNASYNAATAVSNTFQVAPATLTVQADDKQKIFGANNPPLTYTITGFVYNENNSVVSGAPVLSTTATTGSATGTYPINITAGTLSAANYSFSTVNGTLTIGLTTQMINFPAIAGKTYGDAAFALNAASSSGLAVTYSVVSGPATINGNTLTITGAGTVTIAADQAGNANYSPAAQATQSFSVAKAALTITALNDTRTYNGTAYAGGNGVSYTGFVNGDNAAKLSGSLTFAGTSQGAVNAGAYIITPAGLSSSNYNIAYVNGQLTIARATQQITFTAPANKNQGDADFTLTAASSSGLPVTLSSNNTQTISLNGNTAHVGIAGSAVITASQAGDNNYEPAQSVTQTIQVNAWTTPVITAQGSTTFCAGNTVTLQSSVAPAYEWYRDGIQLPGAFGSSLTVNESGSYTVKAVYPGDNRITSAAMNVTVNPLPVGDILVSGNTTISKGETVKLTASGGSTYTWNPATGLNNTNTAEVTARPAATVSYQVTITSAAGCSITKEISITVKEDFKLEATNLLTPNGDGRNDLWVVKNIDMYPDNEVMIFDRAGRIIYRQQHYANNWNGKLNGQALAEGTYYYIVDLGENRPKFKGFITIILDK